MNKGHLKKLPDSIKIIGGPLPRAQQRIMRYDDDDDNNSYNLVSTKNQRLAKHFIYILT